MRNNIKKTRAKLYTQVKNNKFLSEKFSEANFYAVELLESILGVEYPSEKRILQVEKALENGDMRFLKKDTPLWNYPSLYKVLVLSPSQVEQNAISIMLKALCFDVNCASTFEEFVKEVSEDNLYSIYLISEKEDQFLGSFEYLKNLICHCIENNRPVPKLFCLTKSKESVNKLVGLGFDDVFKSPILLMDLKQTIVRSFF